MKKFLFPCFLLTFNACVRPALVEPLANHTEKVKISNENPSNDYRELGLISVRHGSDDCGNFFSPRGFYDGAMVMLKNKAQDMKADYIQIVKITEPHHDGACYNASYNISGIAFKKKPELPSVIGVEIGKRLLSEKLTELDEFHEEGFLTEDEYLAEKNNLL